VTDDRYKKIMADLGMPNSRSLLQALQQVANEVEQEVRASIAATKVEPLTEAQVQGAVAAGWLAALSCHSRHGMAGWSANRSSYIARAIEAARGIVPAA